MTPAEILRAHCVRTPSQDRCPPPGQAKCSSLQTEFPLRATRVGCEIQRAFTCVYPQCFEMIFTDTLQNLLNGTSSYFYLTTACSVSASKVASCYLI